MRHALAGVRFVALLRRRERPQAARGGGRSGRRRCVGGPKVFVASCRIRILDASFRPDNRDADCSNCMPSRRAAPSAAPAASSMASSTRIEQIQRHHHHYARQRIGALQLPGDAVGVPRDLLRALLRIHAIGLDVLLTGRCGGSRRCPGKRLARCGRSAESGSAKTIFRADFQRRADGFGERIGRLDRHVDGLFLFAALSSGRRSPTSRGRRATRAQVRLLAASTGNSTRDHLRPLAQNRLAHLDGELQASRHDRKIGEAAAPQAAGSGRSGRPVSPDIAQRFLAQRFENGRLERLGFVRPSRWPGSSA